MPDACRAVRGGQGGLGDYRDYFWKGLEGLTWARKARATNSSSSQNVNSNQGVNASTGLNYGVNQSGNFGFNQATGGSNNFGFNQGTSESTGGSENFGSSSSTGSSFNESTQNVWDQQSPYLQDVYQNAQNAFTQGMGQIDGLTPEVQQQLQGAFEQAQAATANQLAEAFAAGLQNQIGPNSYVDALKGDILSDANKLKQQNLGSLDAVPPLACQDLLATVIRSTRWPSRWMTTR